MRATVLTVALLLALPALAKDPDPRSLIGRGLPDAGRGEWASWNAESDWAIASGPPGAVERYGWVVWTRRSQATVFLTREDRLVADALRVHLPRGFSIGFACTPRGSGRPDDHVVALVDDPPLPPGARCVFSSPRKAWRLDRSRGRIEPISARGMRCQRECPWD